MKFLRIPLRFLIGLLALAALFPLTVQADMKVRLKDGRIITVPVDETEVDSITYGKPETQRPSAKRAADRIREDAERIRFAAEAARKAADAAARAQKAAAIAERAAQTARRAERDADAALAAARELARKPPPPALLPDPLGPPMEKVQPVPRSNPSARSRPSPRIKPPARAQSKPPVQQALKSPRRALKRRDPSGARILSVGPGQEFAAPSMAASYAKDGDIIEIKAGNYRADVAIWRANNLIIRGVGGKAVLNAAGRAAQGKAVWVIKGRNTTVQNIAFAGAKVRDRNGAGIRLEGAGLIVRDSAFYGNEMGILTGTNLKSDILIERSRFHVNMVDYPKYKLLGHNIYIGRVRSFTIRHSHVSGARHGHNIKSRAQTNVIAYNMIADGPEGASSYLLDLPSGGTSLVMGNVFHQGPNAENWAMISYGAEKRDAREDLHVVNNTFVNDKGNAIFIQRKSPGRTQVYNNIFSGKGTVLTGGGQAENNLIVDKRTFGSVRKLVGEGSVRPATGDLKGNLITPDVRFVAPDKMDFRLLKDSPAIDAGMAVPAISGQSRTPLFQYTGPRKGEARPRRGKIDIGAFEFAGP